MKKLTLLLLLFFSTINVVNSQCYEKVTTIPTDWSGKYLIVYEKNDTKSYVFNGTMDNDNFEEISTPGDVLNYNNGNYKSYEVNISPVPNKNTYYIQVCSNNNYYIGNQEEANDLNISSTPMENEISLGNSGKFSIKSSSGRYFYFFPGQTMDFKYYKDNNYVSIYKYEEKKIEISTTTGKHYIFDENTQITITTILTSANIYYTTDGSIPTESSTLYTSPFTVTENCTIKAIAITEGNESSKVEEYKVSFVKPSNNEKETTIKIEELAQENNWEHQKLYLNFESKGITFNATTDSNKRSGMYINYENNQYWQFIMKGKLQITPPKESTLKYIYFKCLNDVGEITDCTTGKIEGTLWIAENDLAESVTLTFADITNTKITSIYIITRNENLTGLDNTIIADENSPIEYYNLQGVKVATPQHGVYIKKQGSKTSKVFLK